jgi:hypothetical protein
MADDPINVMRQLAGEHGKRLSRTKVCDANVCRWTINSDRPWEFTFYEGEPFSKALQFTSRNLRIRTFANSTYLELGIIGDFSAEPFAINRPERNGSAMRPAGSHVVGSAKYPIFTKDGKLSATQIELLETPESVNLIRSSNLQEREMIFVRNGTVGIYLVQPALVHAKNLIDRALDLAERLPVESGDRDLEKLPKPFHPLIPLIKKWAIGDDLERDEALADSSKQTLAAVVEEVEPYLTMIDSYLDSFKGQPPPQEATDLGRLAEFAVEARQHLENQDPAQH